MRDWRIWAWLAAAIMIASCASSEVFITKYRTLYKIEQLKIENQIKAGGVK